MKLKNRTIDSASPALSFRTTLRGPKTVSKKVSFVHLFHVVGSKICNATKLLEIKDRAPKTIAKTLMLNTNYLIHSESFKISTF